VNADIKKNAANDGTIDDDYIFGRPVSTYVSTLQRLRLLLLKARLDTTGAADELRPRVKLIRPC
jgi:hypothetical protein